MSNYGRGLRGCEGMLFLIFGCVLVFYRNGFWCCGSVMWEQALAMFFVEDELYSFSSSSGLFGSEEVLLAVYRVD